MGCGAAKEAVEEPHHAQGQHEPKQDKEKDEAAAEIIDDRPPLLKQQIFEVFNAGSVRPNVPPLYLPADAGPFVTREKTPSQAHSVSRILVSGDLPPPRILDEPAAAMMKSPTLHLESDGVLLRAFLPHSLSAYCVGCCRPDLAAGQLTPGFRYDVEVEGAADERAIAQSKPSSRDPSQRRRVLLFPSSIDAVGLFVTVNGIGKSNRIVAPYRANCTASPEVEPIDGAFATFSLLTHSRVDDDRASFDSAGATSPRGRTAPAVLASRQSRREIGTVLTPSSTVFAESSLAFSLLPRPSSASKDGNDVAAVERRLPDDAVTPARAPANGALASTRGARRDSFNSGVEAAFASALCGLEDGVHTVSLALRFRYVTDTFVAVYDKPPPVAGTTGMRTVGTYVAHTVTSSAADQLSDVIAGGDFTIVMDSSGRAHLTDLCRAA